MTVASLLVLLAASQATDAAPRRLDAPPVYVNTTLGQCFSPYVFTLLMNTASSAATIASNAVRSNSSKIEIVNGTRVQTNSEGDGVDAGDFRVRLETGNKITTIIILFIVGAVGLLMLFSGEALVNTLTILTSGMVSFMGFLYLWQWACSSTIVPMEGFVKCILPFILACICGLIIALLVWCGIRKFTSLAFFIMGAAGGAVGMFFLRQFILAGNPDLASNVWFNFYWLGLAVVVLLCGCVAACLKGPIVTIVTCVLGGYLFGVALCGLIPAFGGPYVPNYGFFITAGVMMIVGALVQCFCCKQDPDKKARMEQYRADQDQRKKNAKKNAEGQGVQFIAP